MIFIFILALGSGSSSNEGSSGGGHGGSGGEGEGYFRTGGSYGSFLQPSAYGSSGGFSIFPHVGGQGGGRFYLTAFHFLTVDGTVSANGGRFGSPSAGGGSGGSIMIRAHTVDGDGSMQIRGGDGFRASSSKQGGGGAGGRMALYFVQNYFVGKCQTDIAFVLNAANHKVLRSFFLTKNRTYNCLCHEYLLLETVRTQVFFTLASSNRINMKNSYLQFDCNFCFF